MTRWLAHRGKTQALPPIPGAPGATDVARTQHDAVEPEAPLRTDELDYPLPEELIATRPAEPRDSAKMLVVRRSSDQIEHRLVRDLPEYLGAGDVMVFNTTAVAPALLKGRRQKSGGAVQGLFLAAEEGDQWRVLLRGRGRLRAGQCIELLAPDGSISARRLELLEQHGGGQWIARIRGGESPADAAAVLNEVGRTPLPPYILKARGGQHVPDDLDRCWYQTIYADPSQRQSVAAPTAGLHFTPGLLAALEARGVARADVTLHVGLGTFQPITAPIVQQHAMHCEQYEVPGATIEVLRAHEGRRRVIAVGTTVVRTLESLPEELSAGPARGRTDLLICPPWRFRHVDGMLTNFHLPRSTLLALVAAMIGLARLRAVYAEAVARRYRFFSYGDAMLILP